MATRNALVQHDAPLPVEVVLQQGTISGVLAVLPYLVTLYNSDEEARVEMSSYCRDNSQNGGVPWDKARIVHKVKALAGKNGSNPMITQASDATVGRWCSWGARKLDGIARTKRKLAAEAQARLASQAPPLDDQSDD